MMIIILILLLMMMILERETEGIHISCCCGICCFKFSASFPRINSPCIQSFQSQTRSIQTQNRNGHSTVQSFDSKRTSIVVKSHVGLIDKPTITTKLRLQRIIVATHYIFPFLNVSAVPSSPKKVRNQSPKIPTN